MRALFLVIILATACSNDDGGDDVGMPPDAANANPTNFTWTIMSNGSNASCATVGATEIHVMAVPEADGIPIFHTFQCVLSPGSFDLVTGRYAISAELYDGTGPQLLATSPQQLVIVPTPSFVQFNFVVQ